MKNLIWAAQTVWKKLSYEENNAAENPKKIVKISPFTELWIIRDTCVSGPD